MPTQQKDLEKILDYFGDGGGKKFIDLGSGDGRAVIEFAKNNFESYGIEINPFLVILSKIKIKKLKIKNAKIFWGSFWKMNLNKFDVVYFFHYQGSNKSLELKLQQDLKNDAVIISYAFPLKTFELVKKVNSAFLYKKIPLLN
ncbi:MAG: class I SAM-dependent methyltransferase [Patescibacteria group bacterium]|nr:class I SAM-dependent methyltransferase [Patescibacteria group bacterium]